MNLTIEQLQGNYDKFLSYIDKYIASPRKEQLKELYEEHAERIMLMPASGTEHFHNAWPGGYVDHVIRVMDGALAMRQTWESFGSTINYTEEELIFAAINHDLGKIGTEAAEQYIPNDSEWHRKNQGKLYKNNPVNSFMTVPDRSIRLLSERGIKITENEWFGIKLHDGMYDESNKAYFISYDVNSRLRTNLPYVLHQADQMAARVEYEKWMVDASPKPVEKRKASTPASMPAEQQAELQDIFKNLFN